MRYFLLIVISFVVLSFLPFLWHQFSFVEVGFPFAYLEKKTIAGGDGNGMVIYIERLNFLYDLLIAVIVALVLNYFILPGRILRSK